MAGSAISAEILAGAWVATRNVARSSGGYICPNASAKVRAPIAAMAAASDAAARRIVVSVMVEMRLRR
jgi:hypothetical protein